MSGISCQQDHFQLSDGNACAVELLTVGCGTTTAAVVEHSFSTPGTCLDLGSQGIRKPIQPVLPSPPLASIAHSYNVWFYCPACSS